MPCARSRILPFHGVVLDGLPFAGVRDFSGVETGAARSSLMALCLLNVRVGRGARAVLRYAKTFL